MWWSVEGLRADAGLLRRQAEQVRLLAVRVQALAGLRWRSPAADLYRVRLQERAAALRAGAQEVQALADGLDRLACALDADLDRDPGRDLDRDPGRDLDRDPGRSTDHERGGAARARPRRAAGDWP